MSDLELYQQVILDHNRHPRNFGEPSEYTHRAEGYNPLCGDRVKIFVRANRELIEQVSFSGEGCAICKASASILTDVARNKTVSGLLEQYECFRKMLAGDKGHGVVEPKLKVFSSVSQFPSRVKCAALPWHALKGALTEKTLVTTEGGESI